MSYADLRSWLEDILDAIDEAQRFTAGLSFEAYRADPLVRRGVERCVEIISEASRHIPEDRKAKHPRIPWRNIADIGNVLRHGYRIVDQRIIWGVVQDHLPPLKTAVEAMLREVEAGDDAGSRPVGETKP